MAHSIDRAGEIGDDAVTGGVEDAAPVRRDQAIDDDTARLEPGKRADLIARHQPAITGDVGSEYRSEFPLYWMDGHTWLLPPQYSEPCNCRATFQAQIITARHRSRSSTFRASGSAGRGVMKVSSRSI
jgi:hypothetical protein